MDYEGKLRHVRAVFYGFSVRKIIENPYSVGTRQILECAACMVTVARGKKGSTLADATGRSTTEGPLRPYRNHLVAQQVPVRFVGMHPTFGGACGDPPGDRTPEMNENGLQTQVASRAGSVLGVFGAKNHRKSVKRRNATSFGVRSLHGHCCPWKKMIDFGGCDREKYD